MNFLILLLKGFIIGIAKIIPGVSGALIAISFGIYEKAIKAISNFFENPINNFLFLFPIGLGVLLSISLTSGLILYFINNYYFPTILLFIGLIMGGIPSLIDNINIKKVKNNKEQYMDLLLEADPSKEMIDKYLHNGEMFVLTYEENPVCVAVTLEIDNDIIELKNIATKEEYRGKGYAKKMIKYLVDNYKTKYKKMIVGTTENNIPFYVKQGFDKYEKTIKNFFVDNYGKAIWDGNLHCTDMYYYSKDFLD